MTLTDNHSEKYINPYTDFGFKKLFGTEMNKDLLISFLNARYDEVERRQYEASLKEYWDYTSIMDTAYQKGEKKGLEEGIAKGLEEGIAKGLEEGITKGRAEGVKATARKMKELGLATDVIAATTGLSKEEIASL